MPRSWRTNKRKGTRCRSDSSPLVKIFHSDSLFLLSMTESQDQKHFPAHAAGKEVTMGWGYPLCEECQEELVLTTRRCNVGDFFLRVFPQPLLYHSRPFSANYRNPVKSRHTWFRCKLPGRQWLLQWVTALPHTQLIYSRHEIQTDQCPSTRLTNAQAPPSLALRIPTQTVESLRGASGQGINRRTPK